MSPNDIAMQAVVEGAVEVLNRMTRQRDVLAARVQQLEAALRQGRELALSNQRSATMRHALFEWGEYAERVLNLTAASPQRPA